MGRVTVDIKEWVANGRFEGEQKLHNREGKILSISFFNEIVFTVYSARSLVLSSLPFLQLLFSAPLFPHLLPFFSFHSTVIDMNINIDFFINSNKMMFVTVLSHDKLCLIFTSNLNPLTGIDAGDSIQLAVKIAYPKEEISKKSKVRGFLIYNTPLHL